MRLGHGQVPSLSIANLPIRKVSQSGFKFNFLVYGESGTGKTRLCGSTINVPELNPMLFIDVEGGNLTLRTTYPDVDSVRVDSWEKLQQVYDALKLGDLGYRSVTIDSLTEVQKMGMDFTMESRHAGNDLAVPEIKEWNINIEQTRKFVRLFRDLPNVSTIFTALVRTDLDKRTGLSRKKPSLSGKVADEVSGFLDIVTYLYVDEVEGEHKRILLTQNQPGFVAKDRSNLLPSLVVDPIMSDIYKYINGEVKQEDVVQA